MYSLHIHKSMSYKSIISSIYLSSIYLAIVAGILFGIILLLLSLLLFRKKRRGKRTSSPEGIYNILASFYNCIQGEKKLQGSKNPEKSFKTKKKLFL